jgi:hypothetical protein
MSEDPNFQREVMRAIGNLEGTIKEGFKSMDSQFYVVGNRLNSHADKINVLEKSNDTMTGRLSIISGIFGLLGGVAVATLKKLLNL